ncbi:MAG: nuclear transport factor 2 family protein [Verrucomicrobiota bacterium]
MPPDTSFAPATIVQRQLDAYNARDLAALLATYAEDAEQFAHPNQLLASGHAQMRERFALRFTEPNLHAQLLNRIVMGNTVIDHELITRTFPEGPGTLEIVATYEVQGGKIAKAWFISGAKTLDAQ